MAVTLSTPPPSTTQQKPKPGSPATPNLHEKLKASVAAEDPFRKAKLLYIEKLDSQAKLALEKLDEKTEAYLINLSKYGTDLQLTTVSNREIARLSGRPLTDEIKSACQQAEDEAIAQAIELSLKPACNDAPEISSWHKGLAQVFEYFRPDPPSPHIPGCSTPSGFSATASETTSIAEDNLLRSSVDPSWETTPKAQPLIDAQRAKEEEANNALKKHLENIGFTTQPNYGDSNNSNDVNNCLIRALMQAVLPDDTSQDDLEKEVIRIRGKFNERFAQEEATQRLLFNQITVSSLISLINEGFNVNLRAAAIEVVLPELASDIPNARPYTVTPFYEGEPIEDDDAPLRHAILFVRDFHFELVIPKTNISRSA